MNIIIQIYYNIVKNIKVIVNALSKHLQSCKWLKTFKLWLAHVKFADNLIRKYFGEGVRRILFQFRPFTLTNLWDLVWYDFNFV